MRNITLWNDGFGRWRGLVDLQRTLDRVVEQAFGSAQGQGWDETPTVRPACDIDETDSHFVLSVDLPGVAKKDVQIEVRDHQLILSGERKTEKKEGGVSERYHGKFYRVIGLPEGVDPDKIEAQYQDGVLTVAVPKAEAAKPRQIKITEGKTPLFGKGKSSSETQAEGEKSTSARVA